MARFIVGAKPGEQVDHINGNTLDNRKANLRLCSNAQNAMNTKASKDNASGFKGVSHTKGIRRPWWAKIWTNGKGIFLGAYATAEEAARAYDAAAVEMFGEFARTNFPVPGREDRMKTAKDYAMHIKAGDDPVVVLQVAMSAAESSALERAAQLCDSRAANMDGKESLEIATLQLRGAAEGIRALIPPAAALRAEHEATLERAASMLERHGYGCEHGNPAAAVRKLKEPAAAPAAETGKVDARDVFGWGNDGPGSNYPAPAQGPWRVGTKYGIHVYDGDRPVATFFRAEDARRAVDAQARIAELETALLDFLCGHGPPPDCAGKGECVCDAAWPLFDLPHGAVDSARRLRNRREAAQAGGRET